MEENIQPQMTTEERQILVKQARWIKQAQNSTSWILMIAALSLVNTLLILIKADRRFFFGLGTTMFVDSLAYGIVRDRTIVLDPVLIWTVAVLINVVITGILACFGMFARKGKLWAYIAGIVMLALDCLVFIWLDDWAGFAFHILAVVIVTVGAVNLSKLRKASPEQAEALPEDEGAVAIPQTEPTQIASDGTPAWMNDTSILSNIQETQVPRVSNLADYVGQTLTVRLHWGILVLGLVCTLMCVGMCIGAIITGEETWVVIGSGLFTLGSLYFTCMYFSHDEVNEQGLRLYTPFGTHQILWNEVELVSRNPAILAYIFRGNGKRLPTNYVFSGKGKMEFVMYLNTIIAEHGWPVDGEANGNALPKNTRIRKDALRDM